MCYIMRRSDAAAADPPVAVDPAALLSQTARLPDRQGGRSGRILVGVGVETGGARRHRPLRRRRPVGRRHALVPPCLAAAARRRRRFTGNAYRASVVHTHDTGYLT